MVRPKTGPAADAVTDVQLLARSTSVMAAQPRSYDSTPSGHRHEKGPMAVTLMSFDRSYRAEIHQGSLGMNLVLI